jgi:Holliday junction resolvase RusA-like endonuclease
MNELHFFVPGIAKTSGSKRAFLNPKTKKPIITAANPAQKGWQDGVKWAAMQAFNKQIPWEGPLSVVFVFTRPRPKGHYGTGRNASILKDWAKDLKPTGKPDVLKLGRAVEDAMNGIVYLDDSQIVEEHLSKQYGDKPGVAVTVMKLEP